MLHGRRPATGAESDGPDPLAPEEEPPLLHAVCPLCNSHLPAGCATTTAQQGGARHASGGVHNLEMAHGTADSTHSQAVITQSALVQVASMLISQLRGALEASLAAEIQNAVASEVAGLSAQIERTRLELVKQIRQEREPPEYDVRVSGDSQQQQQQQRPQQQRPPMLPSSPPNSSKGRKQVSSIHAMQSDLDDSILSRHSEIYERMSHRDDRRHPSAASSALWPQQPKEDGFLQEGRVSHQPSNSSHDFVETQEGKRVDTWGTWGPHTSDGERFPFQPQPQEIGKVDTWGNILQIPENLTSVGEPPRVSPDELLDAEGAAPRSLMLPGTVADESIPPVMRDNSGNVELPVRREVTPRSSTASAVKLGSLVKQRVSELTAELEKEGATKVSLPRSSLPLWLAGVLPWDMGFSPPTCWRRWSLWYQWGCLAIVTTASLLSCARIVIACMGISPWDGMIHGRSTWMLADLPVVCVGPVGMVLVHTYSGSNMLCKCHGLMMPSIEKTGFHSEWRGQSCVDAVLALMLWVFAMVSRCYASGVFSGEGEVVYPCAFAVCSGALMALCLCTFHVCNCLTATIHVFSSKARNDCESFHELSVLQIASLAKEWNVIQATIRKSSGAIGHLMAWLQCAVVSTLVLWAIDGLSGRQAIKDMVPLVLLLALLLLAFIRAAAVTDTCTKVPAFINAHVSDTALDFQCQYMVRYITDSAAGFYIFDVQVTTAMVLKMVYFCGAFVFAMATKLTDV